MNIHSVLHESFEGLGCIKNWINKKGYPVSFTHTYKNESFPKIDDINLLILMGGGMSVYEEEKFPILVAEKKFIHEAIQSGKTVLGICLGAQMLANVLGSKVYRGKEKEIGWFPVHLNKSNLPAALKSIPEKFMAFHWHGDTFDIPDNAVHLANSEITPNQAFLYNEKVLALQYHYEVDEVALNMMLNHAGLETLNGPYIQSREEILSGIKFIEANNNTMFQILDYLESMTII